MRYYYIAPLLVLAMVACAKRDNNFAKKAGEAKAAQEKAAQEKAAAGKTTTPPGKDSANPGTCADNSVTTNPDCTQKPDENREKKSTVENAYNGDLEQTYTDSCENKLAMEVNKENKEEELHLKDIITKEKGSYVLKSTNLFAERTDKDSKVLNQIVLAGSAFDLPKDFKDMAQGQAVMVNCHTINLADDSKQTMVGDFVIPYEISTVDGAIKVLRFDKVELKNKNQSTALTVLKAKEGNITNLVEKESEGRKVLLIKHSDSSDITIRIQKSLKDEKTGSVMKKTYSATYSLKK
jgi:hypothetical protein